MTIDFKAARWERATDPSEHSSRDALEAALRNVDEYEPDHVIVVFGKDLKGENTSTFRYFQAGNYNAFAEKGLLFAVAAEIGDNE